jgi:hypothetical protein
MIGPKQMKVKGRLGTAEDGRTSHAALTCPILRYPDGERACCKSREHGNLVLSRPKRAFREEDERSSYQIRQSDSAESN